MRKLLAAGVTVFAVAAGGTIVTAAPADAATTRACVDRAHWQRVDRGMHQERVTRILGRGYDLTTGHAPGVAAKVTVYQLCDRIDGVAAVAYGKRTDGHSPREFVVLRKSIEWGTTPAQAKARYAA